MAVDELDAFLAAASDFGGWPDDADLPPGVFTVGGIRTAAACLQEALKHLKAMSHVAPRSFEVQAAHEFLDALSNPPKKEADHGR